MPGSRPPDGRYARSARLERGPRPGPPHAGRHAGPSGDLRDQPVWRPMSEDVRAHFQAPLPREPQGLDAVHEEFLRDVLPHAGGNLHPGFMGWVQGGGTVAGMLAEMLAGGMNANLGGRDHAPSRWSASLCNGCARCSAFRKARQVFSSPARPSQISWRCSPRGPGAGTGVCARQVWAAEARSFALIPRQRRIAALRGPSRWPGWAGGRCGWSGWMRYQRMDLAAICAHAPSRRPGCGLETLHGGGFGRHGGCRRDRRPFRPGGDSAPRRACGSTSTAPLARWGSVAVRSRPRLAGHRTGGFAGL